jgi:hypothetical protein
MWISEFADKKTADNEVYLYCELIFFFFFFLKIDDNERKISNNALRKKLRESIRRDEAKGLSYAEIAYGRQSPEWEIFRDLYRSWNVIEDDATLYCDVQNGIARLIESDSVPWKKN